MRVLSRAAIVAALFAAPLYAQTSFSVAAGLAVPAGTTADAVKTGYNATLGLNIKPPLAPIGVRIEGAFNQFDNKNATFAKGTRILAGIANVTLSGAAMPIPMGYLIGGVGIYNANATGLATGVSSSSSSKVGFNIGAGLNFPLTGFSTFAEIRFHLVQTEGSSTKFFPVTFGVKF